MVFAVSRIFAQTITIHDFVTGIYTPGSSIAVPFTINSSTANCIQQNNQFNLYLADASGNVISPVIGTFSGFYGTFVNGKIPAGTALGTYTVVIKTTNPVIVPNAVSPVFTVGPGAVVKAGITGQSISSSFPEVFGTCNGAVNQYLFNDGSSTNASVATFFNESTKLVEGPPIVLTSNSNSSFTAQTTNYTIIATAINAGTIGTQAYTLINNVLNNTFGVSGGSTVCIAGNGGGTLTYNVDILGPNGIQYNFPGTTYLVNWGDLSTTTYTLCDIQNLGGKIVHTYTRGSCGNTVNSHNNSFEVDIQPQSPYCSGAVSAVTSYAKVLVAPTNGILPVKSACTNNLVTFTNSSNPGDDPNSALTNCSPNPNALYTWSVDGTVMKINQPLSASFTYTFTTNGVHYVALALQAGTTGLCTAVPFTDTVCVQNPPVPAFTLPASPVCLSNPVIPTDISTVDPGCSNTNTYNWVVTGPAGMTYAGGTNATSHQPQFKFSQPGTYQITLGIATTGCGTITSAAQTILVDAPPVISLSQSTPVCGTNKTFTFGPGGGITLATITGTAQPVANTYNWTVTGGAYSFVNGTNANRQYPQINFTDFAAYTISVTVQNSCGTVSASQTLTFQNAPTVTVTPTVPNICPGSPVTLTGVINGSYTSFQWVGSGIFSAPGSLTTDYMPTAAEIAAHSATIALDVKTALAAPCGDIIQSIIVNIYPVNNIISASAVQVCAGNAVNYNIISSVPGSTFSWTAALTSGTSTGFTNGNGATISDVLGNNGPGDAVVTYIITPQANGCTGNPFTLTVTVKPQTAVAATVANNTICSGNAAGITLTPTIAGTTYTWTSSTTGGSITGNSRQNIPIATNVINDVLKNTGTTTGSVTYTITPYNNGCPGNTVTATITVQPFAVVSNPGANDEICNATVYPLKGNIPTAGSGMWSVSPVGTVTFSDATQPNATATGLVPGTTYSFTWTITLSGGCPPSSNSVTIKDDVPAVGGNTTGDATVCFGSNSGVITLSGQTGSIIRWESSTDNGATWNIITNTTTSISYSNLIQTTLYHAIIQSGVCSLATSGVTTIQVNPPAPVANAGPSQNL